MTGRLSFIMLKRLRAVDWIGDWNSVCRRARSRRLLMREYLRRAALWAQAYDAESTWPFFDITESMAPNFRLPSDLTAELGDLLTTIGISQVTSTCVGAVRLAALRDQGTTRLPDLPDLYEPLILFYERGGEFMRDNAGYLDLTGVSIRPLRVQDNLRAFPFQTNCHHMLDGMDRIP